MVALAGVLAAALIISLMIGFGPVPGVCLSFSASIEAGAHGDPTPEAAFQRWLAEGARPSTPRSGWTAVERPDSILMVNGRSTVNILDLRGGGGSGWTVNGAQCY
ncbi:hypothetical protein [Microlunatus speluncae]|uniref:hypothetical protein n=1 Tax=Microlunatus speluncae TaxID=2594267 RepID=UPI0012664056|nr:hypothetical protein [Microlunatus speluncae]